MRLKHYLNESRVNIVSRIDLKKLLEKQCSTYLKNFEENATILYCGSRSDFPVFLIDSNEEKRLGRTEFYNKLFNILPSWENYLKPQTSLIAYTSSGLAIENGNLYKVYPSNESKIMICPSESILKSFKLNLNDFNDFCNEVTNSTNIELKDEIQDVELVLKKFVKLKKEDKEKFAKKYTFIDKYLQKEKDIFKYFDDLLNPKKKWFYNV